MVSWQDGTILCSQLEAGEGVAKVGNGLLAGWNHPLLPAPLLFFAEDLTKKKQYQHLKKYQTRRNFKRKIC
jgi:hypothetical protein